MSDTDPEEWDIYAEGFSDMDTEGFLEVLRDPVLLDFHDRQTNLCFWLQNNFLHLPSFADAESETAYCTAHAAAFPGLHDVKGALDALFGPLSTARTEADVLLGLAQQLATEVDQARSQLADVLQKTSGPRRKWFFGDQDDYARLLERAAQLAEDLRVYATSR